MVLGMGGRARRGEGAAGVSGRGRSRRVAGGVEGGDPAAQRVGQGLGDSTPTNRPARRRGGGAVHRAHVFGLAVSSLGFLFRGLPPVPTARCRQWPGRSARVGVPSRVTLQSLGSFPASDEN